MSFAELGLSATLLRTIQNQGYTTATPIQVKAIPAILSGRDVIAAAQTGTGKTASFTLPLLQRLSSHPTTHKTRALIVTPTRELAIQVHASVSAYGQDLPLQATAVYGGVKINPQIARLAKAKTIVIATPGRLLDLINQKVLDLSSVEMLVLDEADRMLDMGFIHDIRRILALLPKHRQNLLFSATYSDPVKSLAEKLLHKPLTIQVATKNTAASSIKQTIHPVDKSRKRELLSYLIGSKNWSQVLVFVRTKHGANRLTKQLIVDGLTAAAIHGDKSQGARTRALSNFKTGQVRVLVATDIAARGLDIERLPYVVNYDLPQVAEDYVHRIGRTGRASQVGLAISLVSQEDQANRRSIEKLLGKKIAEEIVPGYMPEFSTRPEKPNPNRPPKRRQNIKGKNQPLSQGAKKTFKRRPKPSTHSTLV